MTDVANAICDALLEKRRDLQNRANSETPAAMTGAAADSYYDFAIETLYNLVKQYNAGSADVTRAISIYLAELGMEKIR